MNKILEMYYAALTAEIAYVDKLESTGFTFQKIDDKTESLSQAQYFINNFTVIAQQETRLDENGNPITGFSATLFKQNVAGKYYLSMRGTDNDSFYADWVEGNIAGIGNAGEC